MGSYIKSAITYGDDHGFFLGNKRMQVGSFSKIKTCSWTYDIDSLNRLKLEKYTKKKSESVE